MPLNASHHIAIIPTLPQELRQRSLSSLVQNIKHVVSRKSTELRSFKEITVPGTLPPAADYIEGFANRLPGVRDARIGFFFWRQF
jgi:hypothetical protein